MKPCNLKRSCTCGSQLGHIVTVSRPHYARLNCWDCGRYQRFLSKSDMERAVKCGLLTANEPQ
jgi:hypothetical protein